MMRFAPGSAQHQGSRQEQQDSFGFSDATNQALAAHAGFLGVVADGMGGLARGSEASQSAVRSFLGIFEGKPESESIPAVLERAVRQANAAVHAIGEGVGTTLVAATVRGRDLYWVSVGDSRAFLLRGGRLLRINADHNYSAELYRQVAAGSVDRTAAEAHPERESLTSYLGGPEVAAIDRNIKPFPLRPGDAVVLCSDGVYRTLSEDEIVACVTDAPDYQLACQTIVERTIARGRQHQDNATVIAWQCVPPDEPAAPQAHPPATSALRRVGLWLGLAALTAALAIAGWLAWHLFNGSIRLAR
jgi:PPM family protein phosphatase